MRSTVLVVADQPDPLPALAEDHALPVPESAGQGGVELRVDLALRSASAGSAPVPFDVSAAASAGSATGSSACRGCCESPRRSPTGASAGARRPGREADGQHADAAEHARPR